MDKDSTFRELSYWYKYLFEKLGWMLLAKKHGNDIQLNAYKNSVDELITHLNSKHKTLKDKDKKNDIKIILNNTKILKSYVDKI